MKNILEDQINLKQTSSHTYTISHYNDWTVGHSMCKRQNPDVYTLHLEFVRACEVSDSVITIADLKVGATTSTLQLQLSQKNKTKVVALVTSTNFDKTAQEPDEHWIPARLTSEVLPFSRRMLFLKPRDRPPDGVNDAWNSFVGKERIRNSYLPLMADCFPSMSDTLFRNGSLFDANRSFDRMKEWAQEHPGVPCELYNSQEDVLRATIFNNNITLDIEFKRRLAKESVQWTFTRVTTRLLDAGRMDVDIVICGPKMEILCLARQAILVLEAKRKFGARKEKPAL
ncbi:thioesterase family protein [Hypoxylon rubiginosum]|uniref:Thioesterase family protein n=1 Tax=Hypoxylon rubiginosum TaxID=110542 RepID=A0ACB9YRL8_9PEZI|nr:thioesterase family protein [Hypoxylon rubiginosum]